MSYDFHLINPATEKDEWCGNYTYNISQMLAEAANSTGGDFRDMSGQPASIVRPVLAAQLGHLIANPEFYEQWNPSNGWGKYERLVVFLTEMWKQMYLYPASIFQVT